MSRHLNDLAWFMKREEVELEGAVEQVIMGAEDGARGNLLANNQADEVQDEVQDPGHRGDRVEGQHG